MKMEEKTNAMRYQTMFSQRPMQTAAMLDKHLQQAYMPKLNPGLRRWYRNLISQIMEQINEFPQNEWNMPLEETYLMGYYLQRTAFYTKKYHELEEVEE